MSFKPQPLKELNQRRVSPLRTYRCEMNFKKFLDFVIQIKGHPFLVKNKELILVTFFVLNFLIIVFYFLFFSAPAEFPKNHVFSIEEGENLNSISLYLKEKNIIKSTFWFKTISYISLNQKGVLSGDYIFNEKLNLFDLISTLTRGDYGLSPTTITIPEGSTVDEISQILKNRIPDFNKEYFLEKASDKEGYLFPDTYKFLPNVKPEQIIREMENNFKEKTFSLKEEADASGRSFEDIIIMASILEEETKEKEDREIVSGLLWERINIGMPLQVDAVFIYYNGKNSYQLTLDDLREDHPYNTYTNLGLPPTPISNPGLESITAALRPTKSNYLFYLSDRSGKIYYAVDFAGHQRNRALYLNSY